MNRIHLDPLLRRALCHGDTPDADRATIALYQHLLEEVQPLAGDTDAPCIVATLMFCMARRLLQPGSPPPAAAFAARPRFPEPLRLAA